MSQYLGNREAHLAGGMWGWARISWVSGVLFYPDSSREGLNWFKPEVTQTDLCFRRNALTEGWIIGFRRSSMAPGSAPGRGAII